jgi:hypothetical protein
MALALGTLKRMIDDANRIAWRIVLVLRMLMGSPFRSAQASSGGGERTIPQLHGFISCD